MKVELTEGGQMQVSAETPLEAYALSHWTRSALIEPPAQLGGEHCLWRGSALIVNAGFEGR
ncbi:MULTISPECIES: hypothetical protein [Ralstonia]|jgi:hypothetical protein|uniref:Uncharacterized protein n=1 Tax=Ralstonia pickettii OR214 TaxID=1264675 RepID=R0CST0_RALPI|nr:MULTISPECIES: hypothetical protein [Ralstonia]ENZ79606.1 hypothetical protein OR214_00022 [Ralstonia pickettii OR214]MBL4778422.1 hypothetical protein [Ralstonia sp.]MCM3582141.1 hypothetical protein [Ralstonia pickettii]